MATLLLAAGCGLANAETYGTPTRNEPVASQDVRVERHGNAFSIDTVMLAPVPPAVAWDVLTDFEHMPRYQSQLKSSEVLERSAWHVAQHLRQLDFIVAEVLRVPGAPRLLPADLDGLPVPREVWDPEIRFA